MEVNTISPGLHNSNNHSSDEGHRTLAATTSSSSIDATTSPDFMEVVKLSIEYLVTHINFIENQNVIKWLLNKKLGDLHGNIQEFYNKMCRGKNKIRKYRALVEKINQDSQLILDQLKQAKDDLDSERELRKTLENTHKLCGEKINTITIKMNDKSHQLNKKLKGRNKKLSRELKNKEADLDVERKLRKELENEHKLCDVKIESVTNKLNDVSEQLNKATKELKAKEGYLDAERELRTELENQHKLCDVKINTATSESQDHKIKMTNISEQLNQAVKELKNKDDVLDVERKLRNKLENDHELCCKKIEILNSNCDAHMKKLDIVNEELNSTVKELKNKEDLLDKEYKFREMLENDHNLCRDKLYTLTSEYKKNKSELSNLSEELNKASEKLKDRDILLKMVTKYNSMPPLQNSGMKAKSVQPKRGLSLRNLNKNKDENETNEVETSSKITPESLNAFVMLNRIPNRIGKKDIL